MVFPLKIKKSRLLGFTLIELLVVIAIIGLLSSVVFASLNNARVKARTAKRIADLRQLKLALELYYDDNNNSYPDSGGNWDGLYSRWGDSTQNWIAGLAPKYIPVLPRDPRNHTDDTQQYIYLSNGAEYKLISHNPEDCAGVVAQYPGMKDPARVCWAYGFYTPGFVNR